MNRQEIIDKMKEALKDRPDLCKSVEGAYEYVYGSFAKICRQESDQS